MTHSGSWRWIRLASLVWVLAVVAVTAFLLIHQFRPWSDTRLSVEETARQLRARLGVEWTFTCTREENDGTLPG